MFKYVIENDLMPPWFVDSNTGPWKEDLSLIPKEKALLLKWVADGTLKQSKKPQILWTEKKTPDITPDYIVSLPEKVLIPAEDFNDYKVFIIQTNFKEDKWVKNVKFRLKPKVIHHAALFIMNSSSKYSYNRENTSMFFIVTRNAERYKMNNEDVGYKLPRNSKLMLEIHYESTGQKEIDDFSQIHINFHRKNPKYKGIIYNINNTEINIPPQVSNHKITTSYKIQRTMFLTKVYPHMHLRGKASSIFVVDPKGFRKRIFSIDPYIRTFERTYELKTPLIVFKGSILECVNWFDNSRNNPINPNPNKQVNYGLFTRNEMSQCFFLWRVPIDSKANSIWITNTELLKQEKFGVQTTKTLKRGEL